MLKSITFKLVLLLLLLNISIQIREEEGERLEIVKEKLKHLKETSETLDLSSNYQVPEPINNNNVSRLVFIHSTDVHGHMKPSHYSTLDTKEHYEVGGLGRVSSVIDIIRQEHGEVMVIDSGDQFTGTLLSQYFNGSVLTAVFNQLKYNVTVLGNHEFDFSQSILENRMKESRFPWVTSNLHNKTNESFYDNLTLPTWITYNKGVKIGVIGLTTIESYFTTSGDLSQIDINSHYLNITHHYASLLKQQHNCQMVLVTGHLGSRLLPSEINSTSTAELYSLQIRTQNNTSAYLLDKLKFSNFIEGLDAGLIDAVFAGHTHNMLHQYTKSGIPILISECYAKYVNIMYLDFNHHLQKVVYKQLEGPVPICSKVFRNSLKCDVDISDNSVASNGALLNYKFHNQAIESDPRVNALLQPYQDIIDQHFPKDTLGDVQQACLTQRDRESPLPDFIADAFQALCQTDISIVNPGMIRINWPVGPLYYQRIFETVPFDDNVVKVEVTGAILKRILVDIQQGSKGFYGTTGIQMVARVGDTKQVLDLQLYTNEGLVQIEDTKVYTMALPDFLVNGGDDFNKVIKYFRPSPQQQVSCGMCRQLISQWVQKVSIINSQQAPIVNTDKPRIILV